MKALASLLIVIAGCSSSAKPAPIEPVPPAGDAGVTNPPDSQCAGQPPGPDYVCVQNCGPPVSREGDPDPGWSWLSPADKKNREQFGCPRCLPAETRIATPDGERPIAELTVGARIYTVDADGHRNEARVLYVATTPVAGVHHVVKLTLDDGRSVTASPGHPAADGRPLAQLHAGDQFDGSRIASVELLQFEGESTWDILPSGATAAYVANGVVLQSSFAWRR